MDWNLKIHGDKLEIEFSELITADLSYYKKIWELYIGNNGTINKAQIAEIQGISVFENDKRIKFSEFHYTCLESIICMKAIVVKSKNYIVGSMIEYISILNDYIAYGAHIGRLRDNLKMLWAVLLNYDLNRIVPYNNLNSADKATLKSKILSFEDYYIKRCIIVHGKKLPFSISENNKMLSLKSIKLNYSTINSNFLWNDLTNTDLEDIKCFFNETYKNILYITNNEILKNVYNELNNFMIGKQLDKPIERNILETPISGSFNPSL